MKTEFTFRTPLSRTTRRAIFCALPAVLLLLVAARPTLWGTSSLAQNNDREPLCQFKLSDTQAAFPSSGGKGTLGFTVNLKGCAWEAVTKDDFITITAKAGGNGEGSVSYDVTPNPYFFARDGAIYVGGETLTIIQEGQFHPPDPQLNAHQPPEPGHCVTGITPAEIDAPPAGATIIVSVDAPGDCDWTAHTNADWLDFNASASGKGKGEISLTVEPNHRPTARLSFVDIGGQTLTVTQNSLVNLPIVKFKYPETQVQEGQTAHITVMRAGNASGVSSFSYATADNFAVTSCDNSNGSASQRCDYAVTRGTLTFQPGEIEKIFEVLITDDAYSEGDETVTVTLTGADNANFGDQITATLRIHDNDSDGSGQPLENSAFFVTQHYADFLSRRPDAAGLAYWVGELNSCANASCLSRRRVGVSNAFFYEQEFQQSGAFVYRLYRAAYGITRPKYQEFVADRARVTSGPDPAAEKYALAVDVTSRPEFLQRYPASQTAAEFLATLLHNIQKDSGVSLASQTSVLLALYDLGGPALVLRELADDYPDNRVQNRAWLDAEYNPSFVLTQYFGYLRRDPDAGGYGFWLNVLNNYPLRDLTGQHSMVCAFITSAEYQHRFGPETPRNNSECTP